MQVTRSSSRPRDGRPGAVQVSMYKERILKLLRSSKTGFVSGEQLARTLGISRTMVWKHIKALEAEGFNMEAVPSRGYRIQSVPDLLRLEDINHGLRTKIIGKELRLFPELASTNTRAMEMASQGAPEGTAVIAETQSAGKGRLGRKWISPKGNLYVSVVLRPEVPTHKAPLVTLMGAVAAASAIRAGTGLSAQIKWPNDILIAGKKVSGLLTEMSAEPDRVKYIVLGIGIDVNMDLCELPAEIRSMSTTLAAETGALVDRTALVQQLLWELDRWYKVFLSNTATIISEWTSLTMTIGKRVAVSGGDHLEGTAEGIDPEGRLVIRRDDGTVRTVAAGDVTILNKL